MSHSKPESESQSLQLKIAQAISAIFGAPMIFVTFGLIMLNSGLNFKEHATLIAAIFCLQIALPLATILLGMKIGFIHDFDITNRRERLLPMLVTITGLALSLAFSMQLGTMLFKQLQIFIFIILVINSFITLFWKISLHMAVNMVGIAIISLFMGQQYLLLYVVVIPLVYWARLYQKKHTHAQLIGGMVINAALIWLLLGY